MKNRKLQCRQVFHHAYSTYIQASNRATKGQKLITKVQNSPKAKKKNYAKIEKFSKRYAQKGI